MDKTHFIEMKNAIKETYEAQINQLKEEMENAIASLNKVERTMFMDETSQDALFPMKGAKTAFPSQRLTNKERFLNALEKLPNEFTTPKLRNIVNGDGGNVFGVNKFLRILATIKDEGHIVLVKEHSGNQPAIWRKPEKS